MTGRIDTRALDRELATVTGPPPRGFAKWRPGFLLATAALLTALVTVLTWLPSRLFDPETIAVTWTIGTLGIWRFGWWGNHAVRAEIFGRTTFPRMRAKADRIWTDGWRPRHLFVQMTTYHEEPEITERVFIALIDQIVAASIPATIYVGTAAAHDERIIETIAAEYPDVDIDIVIIRQNQPGKRMAIGLIMRAILRSAPQPDDLILFMDGDAVMGPGTVARSCAMFGADPELQALTTDEEVICFGPSWMARWLRLRFAQRRLAMQSHALSGKVLTLTGRMSLFRARHICNLKFIRTVEADYLDHWLWGRFRFLSGDDKSTWYHMLTVGAKMTYLPDALVVTIEVVKGSAIRRMHQNLRRWSGNMLRNGARAIALGPRRVGPFIWWCIVDQRIAMWTMLVGPTLGIYAAFYAPDLFVALTLWVIQARIVLSIWLFRFAREPDLSWPFILYLNQVLNAAVKVSLLFRPNRQTWANRGNQTATSNSGFSTTFKLGFARLQLATALGCIALAAHYLSGSP